MRAAGASQTFLTSAEQDKTERKMSFRPERIEAAFGFLADRTNPTKTQEPSLVEARWQNASVRIRGIKISAPPSSSRLIGFVTEQRWQGFITDVQNDNHFFARVFDVTSAEDSVEDADFDEDDVPELMRHLIKPGAIFNWDIGFQIDPSGGRIRQSLLTFPMIPNQTAEDIQAAKDRAAKRFRELGWGKGSDAVAQSPKSSSS